MFGITDYGAFCAAILVFLSLPGPGTFALLGATGQGGFRAGCLATLGLMAADQILMWSALAGVAALLGAHPGWLRALQWTGASYLAWLGLKLMLSRSSGGALALRQRPGQPFRHGLLVTLANPKAIFFYMAFFPLFVAPHSRPGLDTFLAMTITVALITAGYCLLLCALADKLARQLRAHRRLASAAQRLAGIVLIGFGLRLVRS